MSFNDTPLFQALRTIYGPLSPRQFDRIKAAIKQGETGIVPPTLSAKAMDPGPDCIKLVQEFEGCGRKIGGDKLQAYPDPGSGGDPWTIGWGSTGPDIRRGTIWTQDQADRRFIEHLNEFADEVEALVEGVPTTQHQFDALVSFAYNLGSQRLADSTLLKLHRAGNYPGAAAQFARWNKAGGRVMAGLTRRRAAEAKLYMS
jgi:lysozyme